MTQSQEQLIRERAYFLWEEDGQPFGKDLAFWLQAEEEISNQTKVSVTDDGKPVRGQK
jgi:hypothetical protein